MIATRQPVLSAARQFLKPIIHVLIRCGVTWREFSNLSKTTYVEVATQEFGRRGRPTNVSRTAVLTGLARRDVRKQRELLVDSPEGPEPFVTKASLVLSAWHQDPEFLDRKGRPTPLRPDGDSPNFATLVQKCGGSDIPATTLLKELVSAEAVHARPDGRYEVLKRNYIPEVMDEKLIRLWGSVLADVATTYVHNLSRTAKSPPRFERAAVDDQIDARHLPEFRRLLETEGQAFLERIDAWLAAHRVAPDDAAAREKAIRLGAGLYHVQDK